MRVYSSVYIGVGGTGRVLVARIKERLKQVFSGEKGIPPVIKFLAIDGDKNRPKDLPPDLDLAPYELLFIPVEIKVAEKSIKAQLRQERIREFRSHLVWGWYEFGLYEKVQRYTTRIGTGEIRKLSRLQLFYRFTEVKQKLHELIGEVGKRHPQIKQDWNLEEISAPTQCFILASIAGGTGSGSFWDIALLSKSLYPQTNINIVLLTPDFFLGDILDTNQDTSLIYANAYACLKELNHFAKERKFKQTYHLKEAPIDLADLWPKDKTTEMRIFILTTQNETGNIIGNRMEMGRLIADFCYYFTCGGIIDLWNSGRPNDAKLRENWIFEGIPEPQPQIFSSIGLSQIIFPKKEVTSLLKAKSLRELLSHILDSDACREVARREIEEIHTEIREDREIKVPPFLDRGRVTPLAEEPSVRLCPFDSSFRTDKIYKNKNRVKQILESEKKRIGKLQDRESAALYNFTDILSNFKALIIRLIQDELERGKNWNYVKEFLNLLIAPEGVLNNLYQRQRAYHIDPEEEKRKIGKRESDFRSALDELDKNYPRIKTWGRTNYHIRNVYEKIRDYGKSILEYKQKEAIYKFYNQAIDYIRELLTRFNRLEEHLRSFSISLAEDEEKLREMMGKIGGGYVVKIGASDKDTIDMYNEKLKKEVEKKKKTVRGQILNWLNLEIPEWSLSVGDVEGWFQAEGEKLLHVSELIKINLKDLVSEEDLKNLIYAHHDTHAKAYFNPGFKRGAAEGTEYKYVLSSIDIPQVPGINQTKISESQLDPNSIVFLQIKDALPISQLGDLEQYYGPYNVYVNREKDPEKRYTFVHLNWEALNFPELLTTPDVDAIIEIAKNLQIIKRPCNYRNSQEFTNYQKT